MFIFQLFELIVGGGGGRGGEVAGNRITETLHLFMTERIVMITDVLCYLMREHQKSANAMEL